MYLFDIVYRISYICLVYLLNVRYLSVVSSVRWCKKMRALLLFGTQMLKISKVTQCFYFKLSYVILMKTWIWIWIWKFKNHERNHFWIFSVFCCTNNTIFPDCLIQQKTLSLWAGLMLFFPPIVSIRGNFPGGRKFGRRLAPTGTRRGVTFVIRGGVGRR